MNCGEAGEPSSSRSRSPSTARRAAIFAILMAILSKSGKAIRASLMAKRRDALEHPEAYARKGWYQSGGQAERNRLRRMPGPGRIVVAPSQMRRMRSYRLL